jgi:hypothetical protein
MPECSQTKSMFAGPEGRYQLPASRDYVDAREANSDGATSYSRTPASTNVARVSVIATGPTDRGLLASATEDLATRFGGEYDGWEAAVTR